MMPIQENTETSTVQLSYYCKHCNWVEEMKIADKYESSEHAVIEQKEESTCIYQRNYKEDYIVDRVVSNKYTIYDYTLPRVSYDCINETCPTNREFNLENLIYITNVPPDHSDKQIGEMFERLLGVKISEVQERVRIQLTNVLLILKDKKLVNNIRSMIDNKIEDGYTLHVEEFQKPKKEILYIKYDPINMKYLYICSNCGTSWKKD